MSKARLPPSDPTAFHGVHRGFSGDVSEDHRDVSGVSWELQGISGSLEECFRESEKVSKGFGGYQEILQAFQGDPRGVCGPRGLQGHLWGSEGLLRGFRGFQGTPDCFRGPSGDLSGVSGNPRRPSWKPLGRFKGSWGLP